MFSLLSDGSDNWSKLFRCCTFTQQAMCDQVLCLKMSDAIYGIPQPHSQTQIIKKPLQKMQKKSFLANYIIDKSNQGSSSFL